MTRIAVITPILPVPEDMTRGRFIYETTRALAKQADVRVFLTQAQYPQASWLQPSRHKSVVMAQAYSLPGIDIETVTYPALPLISRVTNGLASGMSLLKRVAEYSPDVLIGYWTYPEGAGAEYVGRKLGKPVVIGALGTDINDRHGINAWLTRNTLQAADKIVFVSQAMTQHAIDTFGVSPARCATVVNGINTTVFHPMVLHPVRNILTRLGLHTDVAIAVSMVAVAIVAHISFRWFEEPLRQRIVQNQRPTA